ncbi:tyrosine-type recombinase/integrase [Vibrio sp.]|nr:tyrosine-type recombinase/integrase [Vibrio sp.]
MRKVIPEKPASELNDWRNKLNQYVELEDINDLTVNSYSRNSLLAMTKDWNLFVEFCLSKNVRAMPCATTAIRIFLEKEAKQRKFATIRRYSVTIGLFHKILQYKDPTSNQAIKLLLSSLRIEKNGDAQQAEAFTREHLDTLYDKLDTSPNPKHIRDLAICCVMFECAMKRSELSNLTLHNIHIVRTDNSCLIDVDNAQYQLSESSSHALKKWLLLAHPSIEEADKEKALFSAIDKHGNISHTAMDHSSLYRVARNVGDILGGKIKFSGQSMRVGAVKELAEQGKKVRDIQWFGRWASTAMPYQYLGNITASEQEKTKYKRFKALDE